MIKTVNMPITFDLSKVLVRFDETANFAHYALLRLKELKDNNPKEYDEQIRFYADAGNTYFLEMINILVETTEKLEKHEDKFDWHKMEELRIKLMLKAHMEDNMIISENINASVDISDGDSRNGNL